MSENLGTGVSYVYESSGYNSDMVVFQKGKPPLDSEFNLSQEIQRLLSKRQLRALPSGWLTLRPLYTSSLLENEFYTQNPATAIPEYAVVNGMVLYVTNTETTELNANKIVLQNPPTTGNKVNGIFLEVWRALLDPDTETNRPDPETVIDSIMDFDAVNEDNAWAVGENGLILATENGGQTWSTQLIDTKRQLNGIYFINTTIGWVVGNNGTIARSSSGGYSWIVLPSGIVENLNGIFAATQLIAWAVGDTGTILKTANGITWLAQSSGVTANLNSVHFYDSTVGWIAGDNGTILKTTDGGSNWMILDSGITKNLNSICFYNLNFGFAVGDDGTILRSCDGGLSWISQSGNIYLDPSYTSLSIDYTDVSMIPNLDEYVDGEEVSAQFTGTNKNCTVMNVPISKGNGLGTITNNPADITVKVNDVEVLVDSVVGATGQIILHEAPRLDDTIKVYYWYKISTEIFKGIAWITGKTGTLLASNDMGAKWYQQNSNTSYDLNAVNFADENKGWVVGDFSVIRHTENGTAIEGGLTTWVEQKSDIVTHRVQRVYNEGNVGTEIYLSDESIHPDTNIETTKRVQIQYKIRVVENADPTNYPEAGLGSAAIVGLGPNTAGSFKFENMGPTMGDYGLWRSKCSNTVDGFSWAIPMFFVNRRNSTTYNPKTNTNGSNSAISIRPDLLTGDDIVDSDILDVRRDVLVPSVSELLDTNFNLLMDNKLRTRFYRDTFGGDKYGTEILQLDRVRGEDPDGGTLIVGATLVDAVDGNISSSAELDIKTSIVAKIDSPSPIVPTQEVLSSLGEEGIYHPNLVYYSALYDSPGSQYDRRTVPGYFTGMGTNQVTFVFNANANTSTQDPSLLNYIISVNWIKFGAKSLTHIPLNPKLVRNYGTTGELSFFYRGVLDSETSGRTIEEWDSGISGYSNYTLAYPGATAGDTAQAVRASSVEVHYFLRLTSSEIISTNEIKINQTISPVVGETPYSVRTISKINNIDSGFSYKLENIVVSSGEITITSISGFSFLEGATIEIIAMAESAIGDTNVRNGATANFTLSQKKISTFCKSYLILGGTVSAGLGGETFNINLTGEKILGVSATETETSLTQHFCWIDDGGGDKLYHVTASGWGTPDLRLVFKDAEGKDVQHQGGELTIQGLVSQDSLLYSDTTDGLLIGYYYTPYQCVSALPTSITVEMVTKPTVMYISNLGTGGSSVAGYPFSFPLINIPTNDLTITDDKEFYNIDLLRFSNFSVDSGFVQMPAYVPGNFNEELVLSAIAQDNSERVFYNSCSKEFLFTTEGLKTAATRKMFIGAIGCVKEASDDKLLKGEYVLIVVSRNALMELNNYTGFETDGKSVIAVYRLPNKPIIRK